MLSDEWLPRYRLLENFNIKWNGNGNAHGNGNGNAYDRGDYNSSFALRAVELKRVFLSSTNTFLMHFALCSVVTCRIMMEMFSVFLLSETLSK